jgi:hypothetical protein
MCTNFVQRRYQSEVEDLHRTTSINHHVVGLEVEMKESLAVKRPEPARNLNEAVANFRERWYRRTVSRPQVVGQELPVDELHGEKTSLLDAVEFVHLNEIFIAHSGQETKLCLQSSFGVRVHTMQRLQGNPRIGRQMYRLVHDSHATVTYEVFDQKSTQLHARRQGNGVSALIRFGPLGVRSGLSENVRQ